MGYYAPISFRKFCQQLIPCDIKIPFTFARLSVCESVFEEKGLSVSNSK